jgi:uroporphyrinogen decarboxylase
VTSRERMLTALSNGRPDRLPCQVHSWMDNYLKEYLGGMDSWAAFEKFDLDYAMYVDPGYFFSNRDNRRWRVTARDVGVGDDGRRLWEETVETPKGTLHSSGASNQYTNWETEVLIKNEKDFALWEEFSPVPVGIDFTEIRRTRERLKDKGIIRSHPWSPGQGSPWQSFCVLVGTEPAIMMAIDAPDFVHHALNVILDRTLKVTEMWKGIPSDMVETGGGAGSNTVISPAMFEEFCVPYDQKQHAALHEAGLKIVYHLCGGVMRMLDLVTKNGADGLETMTPASMGGDCDLREASHRVGDKLFFIGGFDQNAGFERGTSDTARRLVHECFEATRDHGGYICCPSDHFFFGDPANIRAFADACRECSY